MDRDEFARLADEAVALIPRAFRDAMRNLAIVIEDHPSAALLADMEVEPPDTLYGLYSGTPITERRWDDGNGLPDKITLFQRPIEEDAESRDDARIIIAETLLHEVGHYFGLSEADLDVIEEEFWQAIDRDEPGP